MAEPIGALRASLSASSAAFAADMKAARDAVRQSGKGMESAMSRVRQSFNGALKSIFNMRNAAVAAAGAAGLGYFIKQSLAATAEIERQAKMAGVGVEAFQELGYAAGQYQVTQEALTDGLKEMSLRIDEFVQTGSGSATESLKRLGFTQEELNNKLADAPALFQEIIGRMEDLDTAAQIRIADEIFGGQGGEQFVRMIQGGADALSLLRNEARELGLVMDQDLITAAAEANRKIDALTNVLGMQLNVAIASLAPDIARISERMLGASKAAGDLGDKTQGLAGVLRGFATAGLIVAGAFNMLGKVVAAVANYVYTAVTTKFKAAGDFLSGHFTVLKKVITGDLEGARKAYADTWTGLQQNTVKSAEQVSFAVRTGFRDVVDSVRGTAESISDLWGENLEGIKEKTENTRIPAPKFSPPKIENKKLEETIKKQIDALAEQAATFSMTDKEATLYRLTIQGATKDQLKMAAAILDTIEAQKSQAALMEEGERVFESTRTSLEKYNTELENLKKLLDAGAIDFDTYGRAVEQAKEDLSDFSDTASASGQNMVDRFEDAFAGWANSYSKQLNDMLWESELTFDGIAESFGRMITEMMIQSAQADLMGALFGKGKGDAGWLEKGLNMVMGSFGGGKASFTHPDLFKGMGGPMSIPGMADGGVLDRGFQLKRFAAGGIVRRPTLFPMASGVGLMGEAGPEGILPLKRIGGELGVKAEIGEQKPSQQNIFNITVQAPDGNLSKQSMRQLRRGLLGTMDAANRRAG